MYTQPLVVYMAKLYWRIKKNGKWTWRSAITVDNYYNLQVVKVYKLEEE